jgi:DNA-binding transcriptional regulator YdaS (Cro superfamily)
MAEHHSISTPAQARQALRKAVDAVGGQSKAAVLIGVTKAAVSYWMSGERNPGGWCAKAIQDAFAIPMDAWKAGRKRAA